MKKSLAKNFIDAIASQDARLRFDGHRVSWEPSSLRLLRLRSVPQRLVNAKDAVSTLSKYVRIKVSLYAGMGINLYVRQMKRGVSKIEAVNNPQPSAANAKDVVKEAVSLRGCWDTERRRRSRSEAGPDYRECPRCHMQTLYERKRIVKFFARLSFKKAA